MTPEQIAALEEYRRYVKEYAERNPDLYQQQGTLQMDELGETAMNDIVTDPRYKEAELAALRELEDQSKTGFTASDLADITRTEQLANRANRGRIESIRQNMQSRGLGGSGLDIMAQMQSAQDANEMQALKALEQQGMMQDRKSQATMNLGGLSSQLQGRDFEQQSSKARARDAINQFNVQNRNRANEWNQSNRQNIANANADTRNQFADKRFQAQTGGAQVNYNAATEAYNQEQMRKAERRRKRAGMAAGALGAAGGIVGAVYGGPAGAAVGSQAGSAIGGSLGGYARGGKVPGDGLFPGDNEMNDIFTAQVSPGEVILPRSIANDPVASAKFVAAQNQGIDPMASKYLATQDRAEAPAPMEPMSLRAKAPGSAMKKAPSLPVAPLSPVAEKVLAERNPSLLEQYKARMAAADSKISDAQQQQKMGQYGNIAGNLLTDFANSQKDNVILANNWDAMGRQPNVIEPERKQWDGSTIDRIGQMGVDQAKEGRAREEAGFFNEQKIGAMEKDTAKSDPSSPESAAARDFLKSLLPNAAKMPGVENMSAAQVEKFMGPLMQKFQMERAQANADRDFGLRERALNTKTGKKPLTEGQQKNVSFGGAVLAGITDMRKALEAGDWTISPIGDNNFTEAARRAAENYGRLQSGGAISKDEEKLFMDMLPGPLDSPAMQKQKLAKMEAEMRARIQESGGNADEALSMRGSSKFPMTLRKGGQIATVSDEAELEEAMAEGWQ